MNHRGRLPALTHEFGIGSALYRPGATANAVGTPAVAVRCDEAAR